MARLGQPPRQEGAEVLCVRRRLACPAPIHWHNGCRSYARALAPRSTPPPVGQDVAEPVADYAQLAPTQTVLDLSAFAVAVAVALALAGHGDRTAAS